MKTYLKGTLKRVYLIIAFELVKFIWIALFCEFASKTPSELAFMTIGFALLAIEAPIYFGVLGDEEKKWTYTFMMPVIVMLIYFIEYVIIRFASKGESIGFLGELTWIEEFVFTWCLSIFVMVGFYLTITLIDIIVTAVIKYKNRKVKI